MTKRLTYTGPLPAVTVGTTKFVRGEATEVTDTLAAALANNPEFSAPKQTTRPTTSKDTN